MFLAESMNTWLNRSPIRNKSTASSRAVEKYNFRVKLEPVSSGNNVKFLLASSVEVKSKTKIKWLSSKSSNLIPFPLWWTQELLLYYNKAWHCYSCPGASQLVALHYRVEFQPSEHRIFGMKTVNDSRVYCETGSFWTCTKLTCEWAPFQKHFLWWNSFDRLE